MKFKSSEAEMKEFLLAHGWYEDYYGWLDRNRNYTRPEWSVMSLEHAYEQAMRDVSDRAGFPNEHRGVAR